MLDTATKPYSYVSTSFVHLRLRPGDLAKLGCSTARSSDYHGRLSDTPKFGLSLYLQFL